MPPRLGVLLTAFLSVAAPMAAQDSADQPTSPKAAVVTAATVRPPTRFTFVRVTAEPDRIERSRFTPGFLSSTSRAAVTRVTQKHGKAPVVGGMLLGAVAGFLGGNYIQHSACEYDCGPGGFTWGFTAIGAAGGAAIGLLFR
jgi:hypothetical protein